MTETLAGQIDCKALAICSRAACVRDRAALTISGSPPPSS